MIEGESHQIQKLSEGKGVSLKTKAVWVAGSSFQGGVSVLPS